MELQLQRKTTPVKMRNYGRIIQDMIEYACVLEDPEQREALVNYVAQCMRQKNTVWNKDQESGVARIAEDIERLSNGRLHYEVPVQQDVRPADQPVSPVQQGKPKRKKK
ncbi:MAG: DUF4290 domain-containing protein [Paludibacteraceae bacterium]|nr:DUF4290 domain-containing protein [Paludibacteraceae bacterium]MBQ2608401.1 DUF4290 domain-containing protein [Paludibacteraceae bacterium]